MKYDLEPMPDCIESPTLDRTGRFPADGRLRLHGYKIISRPRHGEAIWERGGERYTFGAAVASVKDVECEGV